MGYINGLFNANLSMKIKIRRVRIKICCSPLLLPFLPLIQLS